ncbi:MAG: GDSL-type esterase/lipase family protein [Candidatus Omnitrophota bacterium]
MTFFQIKQAPAEPRRLRPCLKIAFVIFGFLIFLVLLEFSLGLAGRVVLFSRGGQRVASVLGKNDLLILCLGDSHTWGLGSKTAQSYPSVLGDLLEGFPLDKEFQVINLGIPGMNSAMIAEQLKNKFYLYMPDIVILNGGSNNSWNRTQVLQYLFRSAADRGWAKFKRRALDVLYSTHVYKLSRLLWARWYTATHYFPQMPEVYPEAMTLGKKGALWATVYVYTDGARVEKIRHGGDPTQPVFWVGAKDFSPQTFKDFIKTSYTDMILFLRHNRVPVVLETYLDNVGSCKLTNEALVELAQKEGLPIVRNDLFLAGRQEEAEIYLLPDGHPTVKGYRVMAENTYKVILKMFDEPR